MMLIHTVNFGDLELAEDKIITVKERIPGFPQIRRFAFVDKEEVKPLEPGYEFQLTESDMADIQSREPREVSVYAVATIPENPQEATLNLMAPIVVNEAERRGKQVVLHQSRYSVKHPLFGASRGESGNR
jgi:flagellar assembly factor FliW